MFEVEFGRIYGGAEPAGGMPPL